MRKKFKSSKQLTFTNIDRYSDSNIKLISSEWKKFAISMKKKPFATKITTTTTVHGFNINFHFKM